MKPDLDEASITQHEVEPALIGCSAADEVSQAQQGAGEDGEQDLDREGQTVCLVKRIR
jgi:hypothetical protein